MQILRELWLNSNSPTDGSPFLYRLHSVMIHFISVHTEELKTAEDAMSIHPRNITEKFAVRTLLLQNLFLHSARNNILPSACVFLFSLITCLKMLHILHRLMFRLELCSHSRQKVKRFTITSKGKKNGSAISG